MSPLRVLALDDDKVTLSLLEGYLKAEGYTVKCLAPSDNSFEEIKQFSPNVLILDIIMPGIDGLEIARLVSNEVSMSNTKIIICSSKHFDQDIRKAKELGVADFLVKPICKETLLNAVGNDEDSNINLHFWGVRGTLPVTGPNALIYGGNTSCVSVSMPDDDLFVFDAGTGIKQMSNFYLNDQEILKTNLLISHAHWDHINAFPFMSQLYMQGNSINVYGPVNQEISVRQMLAGQMQSIYFPVTIDEFKADVTYNDLTEEELVIGKTTVKTQLLNHPGNCLGYRLEYGGRSICYITDNEIPLKDSDRFSEQEFNRLSQFVNKADILIIDSTYSDAEYRAGKEGWGHSSVTRVADLAASAEVVQLFPFQKIYLLTL